MKLENNNKRKFGKFTDTRILNMLVNNQWVKEEIRMEIKTVLRRKWKCNIPKGMGSSKSSVEREVDSDTCLH